MYQTKTNKRTNNPISLSAKRNSTPNQIIRTPNKFQTNINNGKLPINTKISMTNKNKSFFTSMKNELSNLKNDVEKMLEKENKAIETSRKHQVQVGGDKHRKNQEIIRMNYEQKNQSSQRKCQSRKFMEYMGQRFESGKKDCQKMHAIKDQSSQHKVKNPSEFSCQNIVNSNNELEKMRSFSQTQIKKLTNEVKIQKSLIVQLKNQNETLHKDLEIKTNYLTQIQKKTLEVEQNYRQSEDLRIISEQKLYQIEEENKKISCLNDELRNHNKFIQQNIELLNQRVQSLMQEVSIKSQQLQNITDSKQQMLVKMGQKDQLLAQMEQKLKKSLQKLQKKTDFNQLGSQYSQKVNSLIEENYSLKNKITSLQANIERLTVQRDCLNKEVEILLQRDYEVKNNKNYNENLYDEIYLLKQQIQKNTEEYEIKIMKLENVIDSLKIVKSTKTNWKGEIEKQAFGRSLQNKLTSENQQALNQALKKQLIINEELRQKQKLLNEEINCLKDKIKYLEEKEKQMSSEIQVQKMTNMIAEKNIEALQNSQKPSLVRGNSKNFHQISDLRFDLQMLKKKQQTLNKLIQSKNKQIKDKDDFIQKVIISKTDKSEQKNQVQYLMQKLREYAKSRQNKQAEFNCNFAQQI